MQERLINRLTWGGLAALAGGLVAISPFWLAALGAACLGLVAIASITPLVALHATLALAPLRALLSRAGSWPLPLDIGPNSLRAPAGDLAGAWDPGKSAFTYLPIGAAPSPHSRSLS